MKKSILFPMLALGLLIVLAPADQTAPKSQSAEALLGAALHQEEVEGNLEAAIETYRKVLANFQNNRPVAAEAQYRIGMCYEKLGRREAQKAYEAVLAGYADQPEFAAKARERLAILSASAAASQKDLRLTIRRVPYMDMTGNPSPDGKYLAYVDWDTANVALYNIAAGAIRALTDEGSWGEIERYPENLVWSPDSRWIAYTWNMSGLKEEFRTELRVVSVEGDSPPRTVLRDNKYLWPWDWAPDGSRILCGLQTGGPVMDRALVDAETGAVETLNLPTGTLGRLYRFTPDGGSILYSRASDGKWNPDDIYLYDLKSGASKPVVEHPADDSVIGILPDTDWLLFKSDRRGSYDLWGIQFREKRSVGEPVLIKQGLQNSIPLSFTNDGLLYYVTRAGTADVFLADFDPDTQKVIGEPRRLSSRWEGQTTDASFSPDGKRIAYSARAGATDSLIVQSLEDADAYPIVVDFSEIHLESVNFPSWTADGQSIVVSGRRKGEAGWNRGLIRVDLPGLRKTELLWTPVGQRVGFPQCARKSDSVYYATGGDRSPYSVMRIGLDGRGEEEAYRAPDGQAIKIIALSPDDETLAVIISASLPNPAPCTLLLVPPDGGPVRKIYEFMNYMGGSPGLAWDPDGTCLWLNVKDTLEEWFWSFQRIPVGGGSAPLTVYKWNARSFGMAVRPDGRMFAFTGQAGSSNTSEAWVMENLKEELERLAAEKK